MDSSVPFDSCPMVFVVPPGRPWSSLQKFFLPFQLELWLVAAITMSAVLAIVCLMNMQPVERRKKIFGKDARISFLNLLGEILGVSVTCVSKKNFGRIMWMGFALCCLVNRSAYQASLFNILRGNSRAAEVRTIDEAIEKKFTLHISESFEDLTPGVFRNQPIVKIVKDIDDDILNATLDPNFRSALLRPLIQISKIQIIYFNQQNVEVLNYKVMKEPLVSAPVVFYYNKNFFLKPAIDGVLRKLETAGLIHYWTYRSHFDGKLTDKNQHEPKKVALSINQMRIAFDILIGGATKVNFSLGSGDLLEEVQEENNFENKT